VGASTGLACCGQNLGLALPLPWAPEFTAAATAHAPHAPPGPLAARR
jgi:hypothetical protein